jgi:hypothetical protein
LDGGRDPAVKTAAVTAALASLAKSAKYKIANHARVNKKMISLIFIFRKTLNCKK